MFNLFYHPRVSVSNFIVEVYTGLHLSLFLVYISCSSSDISCQFFLGFWLKFLMSFHLEFSCLVYCGHISLVVFCLMVTPVYVIYSSFMSFMGRVYTCNPPTYHNWTVLSERQSTKPSMYIMICWVWARTKLCENPGWGREGGCRNCREWLSSLRRVCSAGWGRRPLEGDKELHFSYVSYCFNVMLDIMLDVLLDYY